MVAIGLGFGRRLVADGFKQPILATAMAGNPPYTYQFATLEGETVSANIIV